jgi:hypothetical protein
MRCSLWCIVTALALLAGCGGEQQKAASAGTTAATSTSGAVISEELTGTWVHTFKRRDVARAGFEPGEFVMTLKADGTLEIYFGPGKHDLNADCLTQEFCDALTASAHGSTLTISETTECPGPGDYRFVVDGDTLTTTKVKDSCAGGRPIIFHNTIWTRRR